MTTEGKPLLSNLQKKILSFVLSLRKWFTEKGQGFLLKAYSTTSSSSEFDEMSLFFYHCIFPRVDMKHFKHYKHSNDCETLIHSGCGAVMRPVRPKAP